MQSINVNSPVPFNDPRSNQILTKPEDVLKARGAVIAITIAPHVSVIKQLIQQNITIPTMTGLAIIDTGADPSAIDISVVKYFNPPYKGQLNVDSATHSQTSQRQFSIRIAINYTTADAFDVDKAVEYDLTSHNVIAIIGRDILQFCQFFYDGLTGSYTLTA